MNIYESIEAIEIVFQTGNRPMLVHCNNFEDYVCKYNSGYSSADLLAREYLSASFLNIWELSPPEFDLIEIKPEHIIPGLPIGTININCPCFGSKFNREYKEIDQFIIETEKNKFQKPIDFLKIAFFDIWISNEDRHHGNYNLLLATEDNQYIFKPIDHGCSFHTGTQKLPNYTLSYNESLLSSPLVSRLFSKKLLRSMDLIGELRNPWYLCHEKCKDSVYELIEGMPDQWQIPKEELYGELLTYIFTEQWFDECWQTFLEHLQNTINH